MDSFSAELAKMQEMELDTEELEESEVATEEMHEEDFDEDSLTDSNEPTQTYVRLSEDRMKAWVYLVPMEGMKLNRSDIEDILRANGVQKGFHSSNISCLAKKQIFRREVLAAVGQAPREGKDGYFDFFVCKEDYSKHPKINEDGTVDYTSMSLLENVDKGDLLAQYHPADHGESGYDVTGGLVKPAPTKELPMLHSAEITKPDEQNRIYANVSGKVAIVNGMVQIRTVHEITGDVDLTTGVVDFRGDVVINGNVGTGVVVRAEKTITITGTVEAATLEAGEDIVLKHGIQGNGRAIIRCGGNLFADFIEQTNVQAEGDVRSNTIVNSLVEAKGEVVLTGKRGTLVGGYVHGKHGVTVMNVGNESETKTKVVAGANKAMYSKRLMLKHKMMSIESEMEPIARESEELAKQMRGNSDSAFILIKANQLEDQKADISKRLKETKDEYEDVCKDISSCADASVTVKGKIFRGVGIAINNGTTAIEHNTVTMVYTCSGGEIEGKVLTQA